MHKKLLVFSMLLVLCSVLLGCEAINLQGHDNDETPSQYADFTVYPSLSLEALTDISNDIDYTITSTLFEAEKNVNVLFPVIKMLDQELQEKVNNLILNEMFGMLSIFPEKDELTLDIDYEIKVSNNRLLSIVYRGIGFVQGATRPVHLFHALNINIETGEKIELSDVIRIDEGFIALLLSDDAIHLNPHTELVQFVRGIISDERFLSRLQNGTELEFYFTHDSLGISIGGLGGAAGDHTELEIRYELVINYLQNN